MNRVRKKEKKKRLINPLTIIIILVLGCGVFLGYNIQAKGGGLQGLIATFLGQDTETLENLDTITVLLLRNK